MEIQDRNNLLQQFFGSRPNNMPEVAAEDKAFAEMLKAQKDVAKDVSKPAEVFMQAKESRPTAIKEKTEVPVKENKKEASEKKVEEKVVASKDEKPIEKKAIATEDKEENKSASQAKISQEAESVEATETIETTEMSKEAEDIDGLGTVVAAGVLPLVVEEPVVLSAASEVSAVEASVLPQAEIIVESDVASSQTPVAGEELLAQPLTEEEALLLEQAKYLDNKLGSSSKIKIEVDVKEAKIAEPVAKDVLQNRFEVDSMFQTVETDEMPEVVLEAEEVSLPLDKNTKISALDTKTVAFAEAQPKSENASLNAAAKNDTVLAVSGKEVVLESANTTRNEAFAKINETSSRDAFKGMGKEVIDQIKVNITKSAVKGVDTIDIQLKPEDLGKIQIKMHIAKDGRLQAEIISGRAETLDMLQKDVSSLAKAFSDAGYDTDSRSFNFSFQEENQAREQQKDDSGLLQFIGDTLEQEAENIAGNDNLGYDPLRGLNIRV